MIKCRYDIESSKSCRFIFYDSWRNSSIFATNHENMSLAHCQVQIPEVFNLFRNDSENVTLDYTHNKIYDTSKVVIPKY